ncbi:MAG: M23 family metallopeptidase [Candidatus Omnitrophota bacterium]|nr:M23 family metallopeptidase [Candidatus Omnitrophota bacterium]
MEKIKKGLNVKLILFIVAIFVLNSTTSFFTFICTEKFYPLTYNDILRKPIGTDVLERVGKVEKVVVRQDIGQSSSLLAIRQISQGYPNEMARYTANLANKHGILDNMRHRLDWPVDMREDGYIMNYHLGQWSIGLGGNTTHTGIDILLPERTEVRAIRDGIVIWADDQSEFGGINILSDDGLYCSYGHVYLKKRYERGDRITEREIIGTITGFPTKLGDYIEIFDGVTPSIDMGVKDRKATHLHFTIKYVQEWNREAASRGVIIGFDVNPLFLLKPLYPLKDNEDKWDVGFKIKNIGESGVKTWLIKHVGLKAVKAGVNRIVLKDSYGRYAVGSFGVSESEIYDIIRDILKSMNRFYPRYNFDISISEFESRREIIITPIQSGSSPLINHSSAVRTSS